MSPTPVLTLTFLGPARELEWLANTPKSCLAGLVAQTCSPGEDVGAETQWEDTEGHSMNGWKLSTDKRDEKLLGTTVSRRVPCFGRFLPAGISADTDCLDQRRVPGDRSSPDSGRGREEPRGNTSRALPHQKPTLLGNRLHQHLSPPLQGCFPPTCLTIAWNGWTRGSHTAGGRVQGHRRTSGSRLGHRLESTPFPYTDGTGAVMADSSTTGHDTDHA